MGEVSPLSRRAWLALLAAVAALRPAAALGQRSGAPARVGWLSYLSPPDPGVESVRDGLRELGQVEGKSFEQVSRIGLALNLAAARTIGLTVPPSILLRADRVIE